MEERHWSHLGSHGWDGAKESEKATLLASLACNARVVSAIAEGETCITGLRNSSSSSSGIPQPLFLLLLLLQLVCAVELLCSSDERVVFSLWSGMPWQMLWRNSEVADWFRTTYVCVCRDLNAMKYFFSSIGRVGAFASGRKQGIGSLLSSGRRFSR